MKKYILAWRFLRRHKMNHDERRNIRLGGVVSVYGISFSIEKLLLWAGTPLSDGWWCIIYGCLAIICTAWWLEDIVLDMWEHHTTEDEILYHETSKEPL